MQKILSEIKRAKSIAIFSHINPDPDAIGSALALKLALEKSGKKVGLFCDAELNADFAFLEDYKNYNQEKLDGFELYVSVDVSADNMLGKFEKDFKCFSNTIKIDHHEIGNDFAKLSYVKFESACAIVVFELLNGLKTKIDSDIATRLYFAICGDTGIFHNNNTDSKTFLVCSKLVSMGAKVQWVYDNFFDKKTVSNVFLTSNALLNASLDDKLKYAIMVVSLNDYKKFNATETDSLGNLPNTFLNCGYKIAVILKEKSDCIRCSFRSKDGYNVSLLAGIFGGGGHKNAAGCTIFASLKQAESMVRREIELFLKEKTNEN